MAGREAMSGGSQRRATSSRRSDDSKDEEHYTGELMGKWLTDLPPTMPFHRGQVLVIPQSPYQQKVGSNKSPRKKGGLKARTDMIQLDAETPGDASRAVGADNSSMSKKSSGQPAGGPAEEEDHSAEKAPEKERLVYVSPAERQIQRECSELHDVLQHSQARIVAEKTRRHRLLDANRMSRGDLLQAKHWAFKERKKKAEAAAAKEAAAQAALKTPGGINTYEVRPITTAGDDPHATPASVDVGLDLYMKTPAKPMTPRPPTGPRGARPTSSGTVGGGLEDASPYNARQRYVPQPGENSLKPQSAHKDGLNRGDAMTTPRDRSILRKPGTSTLETPRGGTSKGARLVVDEHGSGAETERIYSAGFKSESGTIDWSEPADGKISLENFEQYPGKRIDSPHSVLAMKRYGVVQEDLERKPDEYYKKLTVASLRGPTSPAGRLQTSSEEQSRLAQMRFDFDERSRKRLLDKLTTERQRHLKAYAVLIQENTFGDPASAELKAFGHAARDSYLEGPAANGRRKPVRGVMTYVDEMASALIEKGRQKVQRLQMMERKRMQTMLKSRINSKDRSEDLQENLADKLANKAAQMAERQQKLAQDRQVKAMRKQARRNEIGGNADMNYAEHMQYLNEKHERAQQNHRDATDRVRHRLQGTSLLQAMKHERHEQRVLQAARAADYQRQCSEEKLGRAQHNYERLNEKREQVAAERASVMHMLQTERLKIGALVEGFEATGEFRHPPNAPDLTGLVGEIVAIDSSELEVHEDDRNEEALLLTRHVWHKDSVKKGQYTFFKFKHKCTKGRINIQLKTTRGDPDVFVGNHQVPYPSKDDFIWHMSESDRTKCTIHPFDRGFVVGYLYVAVYGYTESEFSIKVRWKEAGDPIGLPSTSGRLLSGENSFDSQQSQDSAAFSNVRREGKIQKGRMTARSSAGVTAGTSLETPSDNENSNQLPPRVAEMDWKAACAWMRRLDIDEAVLQIMDKEKVPGGQLAQMTLDELIADLGMSKIQAKRLLLNIEGRISGGMGYSLAKDSLESVDGGAPAGQSNIKPETKADDANKAMPTAPAAPGDESFNALTAGGEDLGDFEDLVEK